MDLVISIKPKYLNKIREGSKIWELRKSLPVELLTQGKIGKIWVWETSPVSKVVGYFEFTQLFIGKVQDLKDIGGKNERYYYHFGLSKAEFDKYFKGCENKIVYALSIAAGWIEQPTDLGIKPPQNYVFVNKE